MEGERENEGKYKLFRVGKQPPHVACGSGSRWRRSNSVGSIFQEIIEGGNIIMPIDINVEETIISISRNGI